MNFLKNLLISTRIVLLAGFKVSGKMVKKSSLLVKLVKGEQTYRRNQLLDKMPKTVLGHNVEKNCQNFQFGTKCQILRHTINRLR